MQQFYRYLAVTSLGVLFAVAAFTVRAQNVELTTRAEKEIEVIEKGVRIKKTAPIKKMVPGEEVLYTLTYINKTGKSAEKISIENPVPKHTRYTDGSAAGEGADITFSVDGGKTYARPEHLTVVAKDKSGKDSVRPAVAQDYTHIRWMLKQILTPGQSGTVRFRAVNL